ncbi:MAG: tetratricopeptide repeat protein [Bacteroidetes bacterium]|jgi:predicted Zn-dependent protease|nr:tetratricopeptide repeat protein [Bacteroidota bacterium]
MDKRSRLEALLKDDPKDPFLLFAIAKEWEKFDPKIAEKYYLELKNNNPDYLALYYHLGDLYYQIDKLNSAKSILEDGAKIAERQGDQKTKGEIDQLLQNIEMSD